MEFKLEAKPVPMETTAARSGGVILDLQGEVDAFTAPKLKQEIIHQIEKSAFHVAVDLADVTYLDSTGLGVLIGGLKRTRDRGGDLVLICPNVRIMRIFDITGLSRIFDIVKTEEEALTRLRGARNAG